MASPNRAELDMVAVAEWVGDQWWRGDAEVFVQGGVSCAEQFKSEAAELKHDGVRVEVLACPACGKSHGWPSLACVQESQLSRSSSAEQPTQGALIMGAWDGSVFGNDDAADFSYEFDDANTVATVAPVIENALDAVLESTSDLEGPDGSIGLAAAALVVVWNEPEMLGSDAAYAPEPWPRTADPLPAYLKTKAAAVLDRMKDAAGNELAQLWAESGQTSEFTAEIDRWRSRLP